MLKEEVSEHDIAAVVSRWTGIPVTKMLESETKKLANLEDELRRRVVGQDEALRAIANAVRRSRAGIRTGRSGSACIQSRTRRAGASAPGRGGCSRAGSSPKRNASASAA